MTPHRTERRRALLLLAALLPTLWAAAQLADGMMDTIENFRTPIDKHDNGVVKTMLRARRAVLAGANEVRADAVVVELYDSAGALEGILTADDAIIDQRNQRGRSSGPVRFERRGVSIAGVGMRWDGPRNLVWIETNAVVRLERTQSLVEGWR